MARARRQKRFRDGEDFEPDALVPSVVERRFSAGKLEGVISADILRTVAIDPDLGGFAIADDMMGPPFSIRDDDDLHAALESMLSKGTRELLVVDIDDHIVGILDHSEITQGYRSTTVRPPPAG